MIYALQINVCDPIRCKVDVVLMESLMKIFSLVQNLHLAVRFDGFASLSTLKSV